MKRVRHLRRGASASEQPRGAAEQLDRPNGAGQTQTQRDSRPLFDLGGVVSAVLRHPIIVLVCVLLGVGGGLYAGYERAPVYTASSELLVGNLSISDPSAVPGAVGAARALASVYARLVSANEVQREVVRATQDAPDTSVSATPVLESPLIRVTATSGSEGGAVEAANVAGRALATYVNQLKSPGSDVKPIVKAYKRVEIRYAEQLAVYDGMVEDFGDSPTLAEQEQLNEARSELQTVKLKRAALRSLYGRGQDIRVSQPNLSMFNSAAAASNDREATMQLTGVIGLLAGLALGAALATLRAKRRARRAT